jgi:hypothetical protein
MPTFRVLYPAAAQKFLYALPTTTLPQSLSDELFECIESYATLQEITAIASSNPSGTLGVSKIRYLLFTLEAHLNEFYIFWRRLDALLTKFERTYRRSFLYSALNAQLNIIRQLIEQENVAVISVRGRHVHERRYFDRTSPLRRMSLDALEPPSDWLPPHRRDWKRIKVAELRKARQRNHTALRLLKKAFIGINRVLMRSDGTIAQP